MCKVSAAPHQISNAPLATLKAAFATIKAIHDLPFGWDHVLASASDASSARSVEKCLNGLVNGVLDERRGAEGVPSKLASDLIPDSFVGLDLVATAALPQRLAPFSASFQTDGSIEKRSGKVWYMVIVSDDQPGRDTHMVKGVPKLRDLEWALHRAMHDPHPFGGDSSRCSPGRPDALLVAHRWGRAVFDAIEPRLRSIGVHVEFETEAAARKSALAHGNDPYGRNYGEFCDK
jgi:hypothetical protein